LPDPAEVMSVAEQQMKAQAQMEQLLQTVSKVTEELHAQEERRCTIKGIGKEKASSKSDIIVKCASSFNKEGREKNWSVAQ
jgi:hypothetical protein